MGLESSQESPPRFAEVAVNAGQPSRMGFTYTIPPGMPLALGQAVFVPYGPRILQGIVLAFPAESEVEDLREIQAIADPDPVLDATHIALARWLSTHYLAPLWDCVAVFLPHGYGQKPVVMVSPVDVPPLLPVYPQDQRILQHIAAHGRVTLESLREAVKGVTMARLERLQHEGYLTVAQGLARPTGRHKTERRVRLLQRPEAAIARALEIEAARPKAIDARVLRALGTDIDVPFAELAHLNAGRSHLGRLAEEGWLEEYSRQVERDPLAAYHFEPKPPAALTPQQQAAADAIAALPGETHLIHGITGSGKTEVYLELVRRTLGAGKGAILLVPEISLTPQAIRRYGERFGDTIAVFHSALSDGELFDQWHRVQRGDARLVLGSRSAIFAPINDLGLVILDEEHEWTYKQDNPQPRYHARDTAAELCRITGATLVLGSATPDIVTYHRSETGQYHRVELLERVVAGEDGELRAGQLPHISVVDMREELKAGNRSVFSLQLRRAIRTALDNGEQSILFVNRRGSARFVLCRSCGLVPECPQCRIAFSLDARDPNRPLIVCHHCGRKKAMEERCPKCDSRAYRPFGVGTQRIELEANETFPGARVVRWDSDTVGRKGSHEALTAALERREIDIIVGTQMIAKGLDLPRMNVVGVVDADVGLNLPDYNAHERAFQLLSQVAGRAGRRDTPGWVYIQTYLPEAAPLQCAANHDYRAFYENEIRHRRLAGYPPFTRMARLQYSSPSEEDGLKEASRVAADLRLRRDTAGRAEPDILGPTPAFIYRLRGNYRWQLLLRGREPGTLIAGSRLPRGWTVDIDPAGLT